VATRALLYSEFIIVKGTHTDGNSESEDVKVACGAAVIAFGTVPPLPPTAHEPINRLIANKVIPLKYMSHHPLRLYDKK
jgi:hypothetical protein